jgi:hypothetical protein
MSVKEINSNLTYYLEKKMIELKNRSGLDILTL